MLVIVMMREIHRHMDPDEMERYSLGNTSEDELAGLEEHLLVCESCRSRIDETDQYVASMTRAAAEFRRLDSPARANWNVAHMFRLLALAAGIIIVAGLAWRWFGSPQAMFAVNLIATRANGSESIAPAGRPLQLHPDLTGLAPAPSYRVEVVDAGGAQVWRGDLVSPHDSVSVPHQPAGTYFVRIYSAAGTLLREFGLEIR